MKRNLSSESAFFTPRALLTLLLCGAACCIVTGTLLGFFYPEASTKVSQRTLTFPERVAYQRAIEDVSWRHRIWPKERPDPKPSLDTAMSHAQLEKKVEDYLRDSQALEAYWQKPITPEQLHAEMERMVRDTKQPEVLRELFEALGNDTFVIAECLARPVLTERLVTDLSAQDKRQRFALLRTQAGGSKFSITTLGTATYLLPEIDPCTVDSWTATSTTNAPAARDLAPAVWTGSEMIVWGGNSNGSHFNTGGRYNPSIDSWTATSTTNAPEMRSMHTAVWTGSEMIVWGGYNNGSQLNTGGRYNPSTDSWTATSTVNAPLGRYVHTSIWSGSEMIVWGGTNGNYLNTGGRYNPSTDSWTATSTTNAPDGRSYHTAVWTGNEMIVWGGNYLNTGGRYNPSTDTWTATSTTNVPDGRQFHTAVWTGSEMIVWGGANSSAFNTGGRYNPSTDTWTATSTTNVPDGRWFHTAVWRTGSEMIVWGGYSGSSNVNTGGRYNSSTDSWTATSTTNAPSARYLHTAVWIGSEMIVWGGVNNGSYFNTGGRYCAQASTPVVQSAVSQKIHGGAGTFNIDLPLTGTPGIECRFGGSTNDYTMIVTFSGNVTVTGSPQAEVTVGTGCVGTGGACTGNVTVSGNTVTVPLTNIANAQTINVRINGVNSAADRPATDFTIPMSILIGDTNANGTVNAADVAQTKGRLGQTVDASNFRSDVNTNGSINAADTAVIKGHLGTGLP